MCPQLAICRQPRSMQLKRPWQNRPPLLPPLRPARQPRRGSRRPFSQEGPTRVLIIADSANQVVESNETDNVTFKDLNVVVATAAAPSEIPTTAVATTEVPLATTAVPTTAAATTQAPQATTAVP